MINDSARPQFSQLRTYVRTAYDLQRVRIMMGNRIVAAFKNRLGQLPGLSEEDLKDPAKVLLAKLRESHRRLADAISKGNIVSSMSSIIDEETDEAVEVQSTRITTRRLRHVSFDGDPLITAMGEFCLVHQYIEMERVESEHFKMLTTLLNECPIYTNWLSSVKGVGPAMAGVILSEINIHAATYPSSLWKYAGLDVVTVVRDGQEVHEGRGRYKDHLVRVEYTNAQGELKERDSITFSPWLKTKMLGVLGTSFLRSKSPYAAIYYDYKNRIENMPAHKDKTAAHRHRMALRYMVKRFMVDLYRSWRTVEGLPVYPEYSEAKLGIIHKKAA